MRTDLKQTLLGFTCIVLTGFSLQAQNFHMVKDVNDSKDGSPVNNGFYIDAGYNLSFAVYKNVAYFAANDGINGNEVWRSDGTASGTYMLKDVNGTVNGSNPYQFVTSGKYVFFKGSDGVHGTELWRTDGTAEGTVMVKDIMAGTNSETYLNYLTDVNGTLFFADNSAAGNELMKSNGTKAGTIVVKDVTPGTGHSSPSYITNVNGKAFYYYYSSIDSLQGLYRSDGTEAGTFRLTGANYGLNYNTSAAIGNKYFFAGSDHEPWISDGTVAGTRLIKAINPNNYGSNPGNFEGVNGIAYFSATDEAHGTELWRSNGTKAGTLLVKDITTGINSSSLSLFTAVGSNLFFLVTNSIGNTDLWKSDGTEAGTVLVKTFGTGYLAKVQSLVNINGILYFEAYTADKGYEMWRSDGTTAGTVMVKDIFGGIYSSFASGFTPLNDKILFSATDGKTGTELWISDGTVGNASLLKDINKTSTAGGSSYWTITPFKDKIYFSGQTSKDGNELWVTNGTAKGTKQVTDIQAGSLDGVRPGLISRFFTSSNRLYFEAGDLRHGNELWSTDSATSFLVKDITPGSKGTDFPQIYSPGNKKMFGSIDSTVFFVSGAGATELWKTTGEGAVLLKQGAWISGLTRNKKDIYFAVNNGELWKTGGTPANTVKLMNAYLPNIYGGYIPSIVSYKNKVYYNSAGNTMWVTDGTDAGTSFFKNIKPQFDALTNFVSATSIVVDDILFFAASDGISGLELWKTDGTANGTVMVKDINVSGDAFTDEYNTGYFTKVNKLFYFLADDSQHGIELWKSDGTTNGTKLVKDITPGNASTSISSLTQVGDKLAFLVYDNNLNKKILWQSDGTKAGTGIVNDANLANVTITDYFNNALVGYKNKLYFSGYTPLYGTELWTGTLNDSVNKQEMRATGKVLTGSDNSPGFVVQPNPVKSNFKLEVNNIDHPQQVHLQILNGQGIVVLSEKRDLNNGSDFINYNAAAWPAGMYIARIMLADGTVKEVKIIKQ